jgi:UPF0716 protein FxsA
MAVRGIGRRAPLITVTTFGADRYSSARRPQRDYIDGEVIDVKDVDPPAPPLPDCSAPPRAVPREREVPPERPASSPSGPE